MIRKGQRVHIKPEWQDEGDEDHLWFAVEDESGGRVKISPHMPDDFAIRPVTVVDTAMLIEGERLDS